MRGFTLIETIIYIALLALFMTGALLGAYNLVLSSSRTSSSALAQEEGAFVMRKLEWAMAGMTSTPTVAGSGCSGTLSVTKTGAPASIQFRRDSTTNAIQMCENSTCTYLPLTSSSVSATCLAVTTIPGSGTGPGGVRVVVTLKQLAGVQNPKSYDFTVTRYLRQ